MALDEFDVNFGLIRCANRRVEEEGTTSSPPSIEAPSNVSTVAGTQ